MPDEEQVTNNTNLQLLLLNLSSPSWAISFKKQRVILILDYRIDEFQTI